MRTLIRIGTLVALAGLTLSAPRSEAAPRTLEEAWRLQQGGGQPRAVTLRAASRSTYKRQLKNATVSRSPVLHSPGGPYLQVTLHANPTPTAEASTPAPENRVTAPTPTAVKVQVEAKPTPRGRRLRRQPGARKPQVIVDPATPKVEPNTALVSEGGGARVPPPDGPRDLLRSPLTPPPLTKTAKLGILSRMMQRLNEAMREQARSRQKAAVSLEQLREMSRHVGLITEYLVGTARLPSLYKLSPETLVTLRRGKMITETEYQTLMGIAAGLLRPDGHAPAETE